LINVYPTSPPQQSKDSSANKSLISPIQAMYAFQEEDKWMLVTGDKAGVVKMWELQATVRSITNNKPPKAITTNKMGGNKRQEGSSKDNAGSEDEMTWTLVDQKDHLYQVESQTPSKDKAIRSVCFRKGLLLVGTASAEIYETHIGRKENGKNVSWTCITQSHFKGELWGLAVNPKKGSFVTGEELWSR